MTPAPSSDAGRTPAPDPDAFAVAGVLRDAAALGRAHDVDVRPRSDALLAFVTGKAGAFAVVDVSRPRAPRLLSSVVTGIENGETVLPLGDVCLVGSSHLHAVDVRDPRHPVVTARLTDASISSINGMVRWGAEGRFAVAASKRGYVNVFDLADPFHPTLFTAYPARAREVLVAPHDVALLDGERIVVVDQRGGAPRKLAVLRIASPGAGRPLPADRWTVEGTLAGEALDGANRVAVSGPASGSASGSASGPVALVAGNKSDRLAAVDLRDAARPALVTDLACADVDPCGICLAGGVLFVAAGQTLEALDVTDARRPRSLAWCRPLDVFPTRLGPRGGPPAGARGNPDSGGGADRRTGRDGGSVLGSNAHDLAYRDGYLYVTAQNDDALGVLEVRDPRITALARAFRGRGDERE